MGLRSPWVGPKTINWYLLLLYSAHSIKEKMENECLARDKDNVSEWSDIIYPQTDVAVS